MWKYALAGLLIVSPVMAQQGTYNPKPPPAPGAIEGFTNNPSNQPTIGTPLTSGVSEPVGYCKQIADVHNIKIWIGDCTGAVATEMLNGSVTYPAGKEK